MVYDDDGNDEMPTTERILASLMAPYFNKGHILFTDNFYTSPTLAEFFLQNRTHLCGTIRTNRKKFCKDIVDVNLEKGEAAFFRSTTEPRIVSCKYRTTKDKAGKQLKIVYMLSTIHAPNMTETNRKDREGNSIMKPSMITLYSMHMGGVDKVDQQFHGLHTSRKTYKWYKKLAFRLISQMILNSHKLYIFHAGKTTPFLDYLHDVIAALVMQKPLAENRYLYG